MLAPISFALSATICAYSGTSPCLMATSSLSKPSRPASASSALASSIACSRWGTDVSVWANTGANGLSLPRSALPWNRPSISSWRLIVSATARRTRASSNGFMSVRIESARCVEAWIAMIW